MQETKRDSDKRYIVVGEERYRIKEDLYEEVQEGRTCSFGYSVVRGIYLNKESRNNLE